MAQRCDRPEGLPSTYRHPDSPRARIRLASFLSLLVLSASLAVLLPATGAHAEDAAAKTTAPGGFLEDVKAGGWIGHTIILCSIAGLSLTLTYAFQIRKDALVPPELLAQLEELFENEEYEEAYHVCEANPSLISSIILAGLSKYEEGYDEMQKSMQEVGDIETQRLYQKISYISLIAAVGPMLGLFGTVAGMISTFKVIAASAVQPKPSELAGGISQALVTTYEGLIVAIPMTVIYALFRNRIANVIVEIAEITEQLMGRFKTPSASA